MNAPPAPEPKHRKRVTKADASIIWTTLLNQGAPVAQRLCADLGYAESTYRKIIHLEGVVPERYKSVTHPTKWNSDHLDILGEILHENPVLTLKEMITAAVDRGCPQISPSTLSTYLETMLISWKAVTYCPQQRNTDTNKDARRDYAQWFMDNQPMHFVFVDEMGFSVATQRTHGRAGVGTPVYAVTPMMQSPNHSVCMAVSKQLGMIHMKVLDHAFKRPDFNAFMIEVCGVLRDKGEDTRICFVLDNCRIHHRDDLEDIRRNFHHEYMFLPPYSPQLNPIEEVFSVVKKYIRMLFATTYHTALLGIHNLPRGQHTSELNRILRETLDQAVQQVTPDLVQSLYDHMMSYLPKCIAREDLLG
jgi:transposase